MTNFCNTNVLHENLDKVVDQLLSKPMSDSQQKKIYCLCNAGHYYLDQLESISSQLCNKLEKHNENQKNII